MIIPRMTTRLKRLGNILFLYLALYLVAIVEPFDVCLNEFVERRPNYVPKSRRWTRLNDFTNGVTENVRSYVTRPITNWLSEFEENWVEYYARVETKEYRKARRRHHEEHHLEANYQPLTRDQWEGPEQNYKKHRKRSGVPPFWRIRETTLHAVETLVAESSTNIYGEQIRENRVRFDTDSGRVGIDNRASACISDKIGDFVGKLTKVNRAIKGFGGARVMNVYKGTILWKWCDDQGVIHRFKIPNSYYVPQGGCRLLSPQHWATTQLQIKGKKKTKTTGYGEATYHDRCELFWNDRKNKLTVKMGANDNVATFYLAPGYKQFGLFCQKCEIDYDKSQEEPLTTMPAGIVSDDEGDLDDDDDDVTTSEKISTPAPASPANGSFWSYLTRPLPRATPAPPTTHAHARNTTFDLDGATTNGAPTPVVIDEEEEKQATTAAQELLRYHHRFGHISFAKLQNMAKQNIIPRRLAKCQPPTCSACLFAKATR